MTPSNAPTAALFLAHLGKPLADIDPAVFAYATLPDFTLPDHSPIGTVFFEKLGFSVTFCPPEFYHRDDRLENHPPIISNVQICSGEWEAMERCQDPLPFGLRFEDDRARVVALLGPSAWQFPFVAPFKLERWDLEGRWLLVEYAEDMSRIIQIRVGLMPKKPRPSVVPGNLQPDIDCLHSLFGHDYMAVARHPGMTGVAWPDSLDGPIRSECSREVNALATHGLELYFRTSNDPAQHANVLSGARYIRKGVYWSAGFDGALPMGLRFEDTPETVVAKVGSYPVSGNATSFVGYYCWRLPDYLLHVGFTVMERRVNRIYVAAHGYYAQELLDSPLLAHPAP